MSFIFKYIIYYYYKNKLFVNEIKQKKLKCHLFLEIIE